MIEIICPWPDSRLSPNSRAHWAERARASKVYRKMGFYAAKEARAIIDWEGDIHAFITFYPPNHRHRDDDNLIASFKSCRDGIADALGVNDKRFRLHTFVHTEKVKGGKIVVRLTREPDRGEKLD